MKEEFSEDQSKSYKKDLTISDYLKVILVNKKRILIILIIFLILSVIIAFFIMKPVFLSSGTLKTTSKSSSFSSLLGGSGLPDLGDFGDLASGGGAVTQELALYENILISRKCLEETIIKFNVMEIENIKTMYDALKYFREHVMSIDKDKVAGTMTIGVYDIDPQRAKEIADFLIYQLNKINIELNIQDARNNRIFIEERYNIAQKELKQTEDSLQDFQDKFGIAPDLQVQAALKGGIELESEIKSEEVKLELLKKILSENQPEIKAQEQRIFELKKQLDIINNSEYQANKLNLKGSSGMIMNFYRLKRDVDIQTKILTTLIPILEQSKISENKETPTVLILDTPQVPDKKSKPKRLYVVFIYMTITFVLTYLYYFIKTHYIKKNIG